MGIFDWYYVKKVCNKELDTWKRKEALDKVKSQKRLAKLARNAPDAFVRLEACKRLDDKTLLAQLATDDVNAKVRLAACKRLDDQSLLAQLAKDDPDPDVRREAFSKAIDQLVDDHELCRMAIDDSLAQLRRHDGRSSRYAVDILVRIAAHDPGLIRQAWPQIEHACHEDNPNSRHCDKSTGESSDCRHIDDHHVCAARHHYDIPNSELLQRFPAAARS